MQVKGYSYLRSKFTIHEKYTAGKTTMLYKLKLNPTYGGTIGMYIECATYKNLNFNCWDVGGQEKIRPLYRHYYRVCKGVIFMIDSNDINRLCIPFWLKHDKVNLLANGYLRKEQEILSKSNVYIPHSLYSIISEYCQADEKSYDPHGDNTVEFEIKQLLEALSKEERNDIPILIFANKQNLSSALSVEEIEKRLELNRKLSDWNWHLQSCSATYGDGLLDGLKWLKKMLK